MPELRRMVFNDQEPKPDERMSMVGADLDKIKDFFYDYPELNKLKKEIQWDVFWKIVEETTAKSGINPADLNKLNQNTIVGIKDLVLPKTEGFGVMGMYLPMLNGVAIDFDKIKRMATECSVNEKMIAINTIFHEYVHSLSKINISNKVITDGFNEVWDVSSQVGYGSAHTAAAFAGDKMVYKKETTKFTAVNEAVTEGMAFEIFKEYVQRTGDFFHQDMAYYTKNYYDSNKRTYNILIQNLKKICEMAGANAGVDSDVVWKGFVRGIFYGKTLENSDIKKWFAEAFSPTFLDELGSANDEATFSELMNKYHVV